MSDLGNLFLATLFGGLHANERSLHTVSDSGAQNVRPAVDSLRSYPYRTGCNAWSSTKKFDSFLFIHAPIKAFFSDKCKHSLIDEPIISL